MKFRKAFTMLELIFVIVIMGIIGKFGTEFLAQAYNTFIFSNVNNTLQSQSATAVEFVSSRLQYRIKDSVIARTGNGVAPVAIGSAIGANFTIIEWIAADMDGFRGVSKPLWSGIIDLDQSSNTKLVSPDTNTTAINTLIHELSYGTKSISDAALYFIGSNSDINDYGWKNTSPLLNQSNLMHPIKAGNSITDFASSIIGSNFTGDVYEYYQLAWTANAIVYESGADNMGTLRYYYNYQPWNGDNYTDGNNSIIMDNVSTFQFMSTGSIIKIQVCTKSTLLNNQEGGDYSLCKEKTVF